MKNLEDTIYQEHYIRRTYYSYFIRMVGSRKRGGGPGEDQSVAKIANVNGGMVVDSASEWRQHGSSGSQYSS